MLASPYGPADINVDNLAEETDLNADIFKQIKKYDDTFTQNCTYNSANLFKLQDDIKQKELLKSNKILKNPKRISFFTSYLQKELLVSLRRKRRAENHHFTGLSATHFHRHGKPSSMQRDLARGAPSSGEYSGLRGGTALSREEYSGSAGVLEWVLEPVPKLIFSNNTGGILHCQARWGVTQAQPAIVVSWQYDGDTTVIEVSITYFWSLCILIRCSVYCSLTNY